MNSLQENGYESWYVASMLLSDRWKPLYRIQSHDFSFEYTFTGLLKHQLWQLRLYKIPTLSILDVELNLQNLKKKANYKSKIIYTISL